MSLSARRAWIEIMELRPYQKEAMSLSARRAWIEIRNASAFSNVRSRRSPQGERGLKFDPPLLGLVGAGRSPQGERGLKFANAANVEKLVGSLSARRAWIEI